MRLAMLRMFTIILCETCQSEGRILRSDGGPDEIDCGVCPACDGDGSVMVETEPLTEEEIVALWREELCHG